MQVERDIDVLTHKTDKETYRHTYLNFNVWFVPLVYDFKRPELDVLLYGGFVKLTTNQALDIKDGVLRVCRQLVLSRVPDESFTLGGERYVGRRDSVTLVVGDDFYSTVLEHTDARNKRKDD